MLQGLGSAGNKRRWVPGPNPDERILWIEGPPSAAGSAPTMARAKAG